MNASRKWASWPHKGVPWIPWRWHGVTFRIIMITGSFWGSHMSSVDSPAEVPIMWSLVVFCVECLNKLLKKQLSCRWFKTPLRPCDVTVMPTPAQNTHQNDSVIITSKHRVYVITTLYLHCVSPSPAVQLPTRKNAQVCVDHWDRVAHICVSKVAIIGSDNGLSPRRHQAIIWTNAGILVTGPMGTNFIEIFIEIYTFSFKKTQLKMSSGKWRPFCLGLSVVNNQANIAKTLLNISEEMGQ